jgi:hypothetical protein
MRTVSTGAILDARTDDGRQDARRDPSLFTIGATHVVAAPVVRSNDYDCVRTDFAEAPAPS